jgi:ElaB/YqjD/DUF883 family membrane-anchored ribosome-binding protein
MSRAGTESSELRASLSNVREDVHAIKDDLTKLGSDAKDYATGAALRAAEVAKDTARQGTDAVLDTAKRATDYSKHAHEQMCDFVRERPTTSVLLAIGVGALLARILLPRR